MPYDNTSRAERARLKRAQVLEAARDSFLAQGYSGTTIRSVATSAGVSPETVYKSFGGKAGLLKAVYDVTLAGDDEPVPLSERPEYRALGDAGDPESFVAAYTAIAGAISERIGPLMRVVLTASGSDPDLADFVATVDAERMIGARTVVSAWAARGWLPPDRSPEQAADVVWTLISPAVHTLLVTRGWTRRAYEDWLAATLLATVLGG